MSTCIKFCSCRLCRRGRRKHHTITRRILRAWRHETKSKLRRGIEPDPSVSIPYTD